MGKFTVPIFRMTNIPFEIKVDFITDDQDKVWYEIEGVPERQGPFDSQETAENHLKKRYEDLLKKEMEINGYKS